MIKTYSVTLDHETVENAKVKLGQEKLSPLINELLKKWNEEKQNE